MSTELEALAARTIAERGVQLVATAHGNTLANLLSNPTLSDLAGGTQTVTLGDVEARRRRTQKTVLERQHDPTFDIVAEIRERNQVGIHMDVGSAVDRMLRGIPLPMEVRTLMPDGSVESRIEEVSEEESEFQTAGFDVDEMRRDRYAPLPSTGPAQAAPASPSVAETFHKVAEERSSPAPQRPPVRVHPFGVPRTMLSALIDEMGASAQIVDFADEADIFVTTKSHYSRRPTVIRRAERDGLPVYVLRRATGDQVAQFLQRFVPGGEKARPRTATNGASGGLNGEGHVQSALREAEEAVHQVNSGTRKVELSPQTAYIRRLQHGLAARNNLGSASMGKEPSRRVVIRKRSK
jgi:hypothetical protein